MAAAPPLLSRRLGRIALRLGLAVVVIYVALVAVMYVAQRRLLYFPPRTLSAPPAGSPFQAIVIDTADHQRLNAWYAPPRPGEPTFLYFGGNGEALSGDLDRFGQVLETGGGLLAIAYRGYGGSSGHPTEAGLAEDARAAYAWLAARTGPDRIVIHGHSLGTGVAVRLASDHPARALVLESPFTSAEDLAAERYPLLPVRLLMQDRYRSADRIARVRMPILVVHGDADAVIPLAMGRALFVAAPAPKRLVVIPGGGHDDLPARALYPNIWLFLKQTEAGRLPPPQPGA